MGNDNQQSTAKNADSVSDSLKRRVQSACTSGYTGIVRVTIVGDVGYWYFRRGAIIHAATLDLVGDAAALQMLSWEGGQWDPCTRTWPSEQSVFLSWVELFQRARELRSATVARELAPSSQPVRLSAFALPSSAPRLPLASLGALKPAQPEPPPLSPSQLESLAGVALDFALIESDGLAGAVRSASGPLTELVNFGSHLCDRIGSLIGAGRCRAFEVAYPVHSLVFARSGPSTLGLTMPRGGELERVKAKLRI